MAETDYSPFFTRLEKKIDSITSTLAETNKEQSKLDQRVNGLEKDNAMHWENYNKIVTPSFEDIRAKIQDNNNSVIQLAGRDSQHEKEMADFKENLNGGLRRNEDATKSSHKELKEMLDTLTDGKKAEVNQKKGRAILFASIAAVITIICIVAASIAPYLSWKV